jgi:hypothetical protein
VVEFTFPIVAHNQNGNGVISYVLLLLIPTSLGDDVVNAAERRNDVATFFEWYGCSLSLFGIEFVSRNSDDKPVAEPSGALEKP